MKAFPRCDEQSNLSKDNELGMDLRDYFAAKAMQALIQRDEQSIAWEAYRLADEMMKVRKA